MSHGLDPAYRRLHADATSLLEGWTAPTPGQDARRESFLAHLRAHPDAMAKQGPPAHLTASCLVLDPAGGHVLLTLHRKAHQWFQFGGHYEPGDASVLAAATREGREESGLPGLEVHPNWWTWTGTPWSARSAAAVSTWTCGSPRWPSATAATR